MAATATYECKCCKKPFVARVADRQRGWALFCSKACKALNQSYGSGGLLPKKKGGKVNPLPRPDGVTPLKFKTCCECGEPAVNGLRSISGTRWYCLEHFEDEQWCHPFSEEAIGGGW